jgi:phosphatidylglycerophosphatase A
MFKFLVTFVSTAAYAGYMPLVPGTFGSLVGVALYFIVKDSLLAMLGAVAAVTLAGFWSAGRMEKLLGGKKDPSCVVIDEVCGMLITMLFVPYDIRFVVLGFFLFRLLDTIKPFPANGLQKLRGSAGVMIDDIVAGMYANLVLQVVWRAVVCRTS